MVNSAAAGPVPQIELRGPGGRGGPMVAVSDPLMVALRRARAINKGRDEVDVTFASLLVGLLLNEGDVGGWLRDQMAQPTQAALLRMAKTDAAAYEALARTDPQDLPGPRTFSVSARRALEGAATTTDTQRRAIDTADVLMAMLSLPDYHEADFRSMGVDRGGWLKAFHPVFQAATLPLDPPAVPADPPAASPGDALDLAGRSMESHVAHALRVAHALAGSNPVGAAQVLAAVRGAGDVSSPAFQRLRQLLGPPPEGWLPAPLALPADDRLDPHLLRQLQRAGRPAAGAASPTTIWGRDLVTAALLCPDERVLPALDGDRNALDALRDAWYRFVVAGAVSRPPTDWAAWWREAGVALPQPPRAAYAVEHDTGEDRLGIGAEAAAFARLILDKDVKPPLSIGLLGDWGSGKSFFIGQIRKHIGELLDDPRPELHASVVQIEFNAWHASDANLWASLVTNIFDEVWRKVSATDDRIDPEQARARLGEQIKRARGAVHEAEAQVETGRLALAQAEQELQHKRQLLALTAVAGDAIKARIDRLADAAGWRAPLQTISDVDKAARALLASGSRMRQIGAALLERPGWRIALPVGLCFGAAWLALALIDGAGLGAWQQKLSQVLATVAGIVGAVVAPLKLAKGKVDALVENLGDIQKRFEGKLQTLKTSDALADLREARELESARRELESSEESVRVARTQLAELMNQQVALDPAHRLGSFLQERVQSGPYRSQQGIISLVHKDFSELSLYMKGLREQADRGHDGPGAPPAASEAPQVRIKPIDRIVLYVDDLDRCRPAQVVAMLEAVHLLLALDLFVVVVAVDSRWLTRALQVHYSELLGSGPAADDRDALRESTPQNYLEKIFQITYALAPMQAGHLRDYVDSLAGAPVQRPRGGMAPAAPAAAAPGPGASATMS
jgi:hypothetical protein